MIALLFVREDVQHERRSVYRFEEPTDWAEDSTVSESRKQYYEEVYVVEIEEWKRDHM